MPVRQSTSTVELIEPEAESDRNVTPLNGQPFHNHIGSSDSFVNQHIAVMNRFCSQKSVETSLLSQTPKKKGVTARALLRSIQEGQSNWIRSEPSQESHGRKNSSQRDNYNCTQYETPKFSSTQNHSDLLSMNKADSERAYREHQNVNRRSFYCILLFMRFGYW
ncbi:unnamed protein product [Anisakis simplex]|uniref:Uncharacterized protein n=1 Tax=Anisakis simplex TaxID=6269 RepID=A0A0M3J7N9_ANISI|nr:unnamed protein product [Anisakis simplex]